MVKGGILDSVYQLLCPLGIQSGMPFLTIYLEGFEGVEVSILLTDGTSGNHWISWPILEPIGAFQTRESLV